MILIDCTYDFLEVCDKSKVYFIPASYDKEHNTYIPPMIMPKKEELENDK